MRKIRVESAQSPEVGNDAGRRLMSTAPPAGAGQAKAEAEGRYKGRPASAMPSSRACSARGALGLYSGDNGLVGQWGETKAATLKATAQAAANDQSVILISLGMSVNAES